MFIDFIGLQHAGTCVNEEATLVKIVSFKEDFFNTGLPALLVVIGTFVTAIPAYLCIIAMPLFYSISEGISIGIISYVVINLFCKKGKEIKPLLYVLAVLFVLKYIFL